MDGVVTSMTVRRLTYISHSVLPSRAANSVHVMKMADAFARDGCRTQLVAFRSLRRWSSKKGLRTFYRVSGDFQLSLLPTIPQRVNRVYISAIGLTLAGLWRSDAVYTRVPQAAAFCARVGMPCCLELHHPINRNSPERKALLQFLSNKHLTPIVSITEALKHQLINDLGCHPDQIFVAPDAADPIAETEIAVLEAPAGGRLRVGFLGHLYRGKGMELIEQIVPEVPWADFLIVGGTENDISYWKDRLAGLNNIHFEGFVPHAKTAGYLKSFDIALLPNQNHVSAAGDANINISRWTSPLKAFEYMAAGLPIIASDQKNLREIFQNDHNALLCSPNNCAEWKSALTKLRADPDLRARLGSRAYKDFTEKYSWDARSRNVIQFLNQTISNWK